MTTAWLTSNRLRFQTHNRSKQIVAFSDSVAPEDRINEADLLIAHNGFRRITPWADCTDKAVGMIADIVKIDRPCPHTWIWFRENQWECRLCHGRADTYSDLMNMIVTERN